MVRDEGRGQRKGSLPTLYAVPAALRSSSVLPTVATFRVRVRVRVRARVRVRVRVRLRVLLLPPNLT